MLLALAKSIKVLHESGRVHLDIKPQNFLVLSGDNDRLGIKLIDLDSLVSLKDIKERKIRSLSYTERYAAPEILQKKWDAISEKADVYSLGAVLFERIMNRLPNYEDRDISASWDLEKVFLKDNPAGIRVLEQIFRRTLTASVNRRYSNVAELITDLKKLIELCSKKEYIHTKMVLSDVSFVGRQEELENLRQLLLKNRAVFVRGFRGYGKTMLVKEYLKRYKKEYDAIHFFTYKGSLEEFIEEVQTGSTEEESIVRKLKQIRRLANERVLFIIDNFDVRDDDLLDEILTIPAKFIFTSRTAHSFLEYDEIKEMVLGTLKTEELVSIFENEIHETLAGEQLQKVISIIHHYKNFSYIIPRIAKYIYVSSISIEEVYEKIQEAGIVAFDDFKDVAATSEGFYASYMRAWCKWMLEKTKAEKQYEKLISTEINF